LKNSAAQPSPPNTWSCSTSGFVWFWGFLERGKESSNKERELKKGRERESWLVWGLN